MIHVNMIELLDDERIEFASYGVYFKLVWSNFKSKAIFVSR